MLSEWLITLWHVERSDLRSLDKDGQESEGVAVYLSVMRLVEDRLNVAQLSRGVRGHRGEVTIVGIRRMKHFGGVLCLVFLACASPPAETSTDDGVAAQVIDATEGILTALRDRDTASLRERLDPAVRFIAVSADAANDDTRIFDLEDFLEVVAQSTEPLVERIWRPQVQLDGPVASLWAPYDFHIGERFSHCGHAAFQYILRDGTWRLVSEIYTVRLVSCRTSSLDP